MIGRLMDKQWLWAEPLYIRDPTLTPVPSPRCPFIIWSLWKSTDELAATHRSADRQTFLKFNKLDDEHILKSYHLQ